MTQCGLSRGLGLIERLQREYKTHYHAAGAAVLEFSALIDGAMRAK
jgi:hypothetical protein